MGLGTDSRCTTISSSSVCIMVSISLPTLPTFCQFKWTPQCGSRPRSSSKKLSKKSHECNSATYEIPPLHNSCRYMAEILQTQRKTLNSQSINLQNNYNEMVRYGSSVLAKCSLCWMTTIFSGLQMLLVLIVTHFHWVKGL